MLIHHYTNIESLAMILSTRKIRFNRLDRMDDLEEGRVEAQGIPLGKYTYVSCWTEDDEESIPLWKMYANNDGGVRISLPVDMFKDYFIIDGLMGDDNVSAQILSMFPKMASTITWKIPSNEYFRKKYLIIPVYSHNLNNFYIKIHYVDDVATQTKDIVVVSHNENGTCNKNFKISKVGKYKHKRWAFQHESRFVLTIIPVENEISLDDANSYIEFVGKALSTGMQPYFETYDMSLRDDLLDELEVTLSPSITAGQRVIVESLLKQYAPKAKLMESSLKQYVQMK